MSKSDMKDWKEFNGLLAIGYKNLSQYEQERYDFLKRKFDVREW